MKKLDLKNLDNKITNWLKKHKIIAVIIALVFWQVSWIYILWLIWKSIPGKHSRKLKVLGISALGTVLLLIAIPVINIFIPADVKQGWEDERIAKEQLKQEQVEQKKAERQAKEQRLAKAASTKKAAQRVQEIKDLGLEDNATDQDIAIAKKTLAGIESNKSTAQVCTHMHIEENARNPKSVTFPFLDRPRVRYQDDGFYYISGYFDAKNAFNAEIRTQYHCKTKLIDPDKYLCSVDCEFIAR